MENRVTIMEADLTGVGENEPRYYLMHWLAEFDGAESRFSIVWDRTTKQFDFEGDPDQLTTAARALVDAIMAYGTEQYRARLLAAL